MEQNVSIEPAFPPDSNLTQHSLTEDQVQFQSSRRFRQIPTYAWDDVYEDDYLGFNRAGVSARFQLS